MRAGTKWIPSAVMQMLVAFALMSGACEGSSLGGDDVPASTRTCAAPYPAGPPTAETVFCADPDRMESGRVTHIVDGDTLDVLIDGRTERVRVYGIDTPERGEPCYAEATARMRALAGDDVRLLPDARERDRNGRLLRYVYTAAGVSIDALLIEDGLAIAWTQDGEARQALIAIEARARSTGRGCLWE